MKIFALKEGLFSVGNSKTFQPFKTGVDKLSDRERGSFLLAVQPFLIVLDDEVILLDTGLGLSEGGVLQLVNNINKVGYQVEQVTKVLLSHLHRDHVGGIFVSAAVDATLTFPKATYYVQQRELEYGLKQTHASYNLEVLQKIAASSQFQFLTADSGKLHDQLTYKVTGGHTPYHQVFWIKDDAETFFYGADVTPQLFFLKHKMIGKYDYDGKKTMQYRADFLQEAVAEDWTFLLYHDAEFPLWNPNKVSL
ncbi:MBL fold metallo-hydrolase [Flavobacterium sp. HSC-61S13]|uniref:MBL fold metallo-hydrolase n=1 Tax=Flavobacterium sp. HSC-61S13 TaxID=2910963 RepID=UPI00209CE315|nr:MBL fold metallo-hydrolase [Flavobacterium sp. HSC-61S13]MCP1995493.1 glyoxylase-like metal-dependent hydrolase (beta-lactamase superfamily II) [Flavobacterium sp. HSC-61S13]